jgi:hypothetical protein
MKQSPRLEFEFFVASNRIIYNLEFGRGHDAMITSLLTRMQVHKFWFFRLNRNSANMNLIACHIINLGGELNELSHKNTIDKYPLASLYSQHTTFASIRDYGNVIKLPKQGEN